jgi:tRNA modification GTPase
MNMIDTIAAISTAVGAAGRVIVRLSGPEAHGIGGGLCAPVGDVEGGWPPRRAASRLMRIQFRGEGCPGWVYWFCAPGSYTGEDLVEFHLPGSPVLARMLLEELIERGARQAEAGEFTSRAWFNGRMDLTEAEGVAATIHASNERELAAARQLMAGELSRRLRPAMDALAQTLALVEVGIDFVEEDVTFLSAEEVRRRVEEVERELGELVEQSARFERLAHEPQVVLAGRPNAGKSTLLNALAGQARAVVSPVAGTTRDVLSAEVVLPRGMVRVVDAAGVGENADGLMVNAESDEPGRHVAFSIQHSAFPLENAMRRRALAAVEGADVLVLVVDVRDDRAPVALGRAPDVVVRTKADLLGDSEVTRAAGPCGAGWRSVPQNAELTVSAVTGAGMEALRGRLDELAFGMGGGGSALALNARHLQAIGEGLGALARAREAVEEEAGVEIVALELREALDALGRVLGSVTPDDVLGRIFAGFCIGK